MMDHRNLQGYGENPPHAQWPNDARVAVSVVVNIEEGSERAISRGDAINEPLDGSVGEIPGKPNLTMESHADFGTRAGYWRVMRLFEKYGVHCTLNACAEALQLSPWLATNALERGHEISAHGYRWQSPAYLTEDQERALIAQTVEAVENVCGQRPVGWHCRCPHTLNTRRLLGEEGGFLYDSDAYDDDLPYIVDNGGHEHVVIPYSLDTNDMWFRRPGGGFVRSKDFSDFVIDAFDWLWDEGETSPKMMTVGLHLRTIGRPPRIGGLDTILKHMTSKGSVWFARRDEIARHWLKTHGSGA